MGQIDKQFLMVTLVFVLFMLVIAKTIILARQQKENPAVKASHSHPNPVSNNEEGLKRKNKIIFLVFGSLLLAGVVAYFIVGNSSGSDGDRDSSMASMIPIWVAVFIPIMANKKNKQNNLKMTSEQRRNFFTFLGLTLRILAKLYSLISPF